MAVHQTLRNAFPASAILSPAHPRLDRHKAAHPTPTWLTNLHLPAATPQPPSPSTFTSTSPAGKMRSIVGKEAKAVRSQSRPRTIPSFLPSLTSLTPRQPRPRRQGLTRHPTNKRLSRPCSSHLRHPALL
ncbi:hypothetical protein E2C01_079280 [Portunus trituberculatus]|uniref:Uncharacterized protein n=1 Tax=Portunus trituberculatus TaxID=210409 RepID=A0A5B7IJ57_PORTR|nr:hypothetical protein [Portunus trituberculatus]